MTLTMDLPVDLEMCKRTYWYLCPCLSPAYDSLAYSADFNKLLWFHPYWHHEFFFALCWSLLTVKTHCKKMSSKSCFLRHLYVNCCLSYVHQQRHRSDSQVNNRKSLVLREGKLVEAKWQTVVVGDIIKMENDQFVAVILHVLLSLLEQ